MTEEQFANDHRETIDKYWHRISNQILEWKRSYEWQGKRGAEAVQLRNEIEDEVRKEVAALGFLSKRTFDRVFIWGFGSSSSNAEPEVRLATQAAFQYLRDNRLADAALALMSLPGVGISRASKVLALSNQAELGIYDSRAADGLSDLTYKGRPLVPVPPGRSVP